MNPAFTEKAHFLKSEYAKLLQQIAPATVPGWGKMNPQQMVEHMAEYIAMGSGKIPVQKVLTPEENIDRMQAFLMSDKPFRENTPNVLMPDTPPAPQHAGMPEAIAALQQEVDHLFNVFEHDPGYTVLNPFFGALDYEKTVFLLHKHAWHHLRQFGL